MFDYLIIGKGLVGAATAKYLSRFSNNVAIIGPDEPLGNLNSAEVFASHYDQGRVQRMIGVDPVWTLLNKQSVDAYAQLENESGISFHSPVGCLYVSPDHQDDYLKKLPLQAQQFGIPYQLFDGGATIHRALPDFVFPAEARGMLEAGPSGHINPLQLIKAQLTIFQKNGGTLSTETVRSVSRHTNGYTIQTLSGEIFKGKKVLVAAGAFSNFFDLLPRKLDLELESETVLLAQVEAKEAQRLSTLPSLLYEIKNSELNGIYSIRPIRYPDGNYYLKLGCNLATDIPFTSLEEIQDWFRNGDSNANLNILKEALHTLMPQLKTIGFATKRCVISRTRHHQMYIGNIDDQALFAATGGNGYCAMCSDALGRICAHYLIHDTMPEDYSPTEFEPIFT